MNGYLRLFALAVVLLVIVAVSSDALAQFPPTGVTASDETYTDKVAITWNPAPGAYQYLVYRADSSGGTKTHLGGDNRTSYDDTSATPGVLYYYWVRAVSTSGVSGYSSYNSGWRKLSVPTGVSATDGTYMDIVRITWSSVSGASYYRVYRGTATGGVETALGSWQTGRSYNDASAIPGVTYRYWVRAAINSGGFRASSYSGYNSGWRRIAVPTGVSASYNTYTDRVEITWDSVDDVSHYLVYRSDSEGETKTVLSDWQTETSYSDRSAIPGVLYYYWVRAGNAIFGGYSVSAYSSYDMGRRKVAAPTGVSASDGTYTDRVEISWDSVDDVNRYLVSRSELAGGTKTIVSGLQPETTFADTSAAPGTTYYYWVRAANLYSGGYVPSDYSSYDSGWRRLSSPTGVSASDGTSAENVKIIWESVSGASYYQVGRSNSLKGTITDLGSWQRETSYADRSATPGTTYYYWVKASTNSKGDHASGYGSNDSGWRKLSAPTGVSASDGTFTDKVGITWKNVSGASYYQVWRAVSPKGTRTAISGWQRGKSYDDISATPGRTYYYCVTAATTDRGFRVGNYSVYDSGWRKLSAPTGVSASDGTYADKVGIAWNSVSGASYYRVLRATSLGGVKTALGSWQSEMSYNDASATPGMTYYYWVSGATSSSGTRVSDYSSYDTGWQARSSGGPMVYVDIAATGGNDGTSWTNAYNYFHDALANVGFGDEIWVAEGTYRPDEGSGVISGDREATFELRNDVVIYGGFPSGGGDWVDRNPDGYQTILSGDLAGDDGADFANNGDNSYHVVTGSFTVTTAILDGFTITAGNATGASMPHDAGGGMRNESGNPTVRNCTFRGNSAKWGGGMENFEASPVIVNCTFSENFASVGGGVNNFNSNMLLTGCTFSDNSATRGGGMYNRSSSSPTLTDCTFSGNSAPRGGGMYNQSSSPTLTDCAFSGNPAGIHGGGMYNIADSNPTLISCTFGGNTAEAFGGGMVNTQSSNSILTDCTFSENSAEEGSGMYNTEGSSPTVTGCTFSGNSATFGGGMSNNANSNPTITDCTFTGNTVDYDTGELGSYGGGMHNNSSSPIVTGCTFSGNSANSGGGMSNNTNSNPTITDCTFTGNTVAYDASALGSYGGGMFNGRSCSPIVANCTFQSNSADHGSGMCNYNESSTTVTGCAFVGNSSSRSGGGMVSFGCTLTVTNCTFSGNTADLYGGGMSNWYCSPIVTGCTFSGNSADREGGGMWNVISGSPIVSNCILWGNTASIAGNEIHNQDINIIPIISYSDIAGCLAGGAWDISLGTDAGGNIDDDPLFVDADGADDTPGTEDDNLRLWAHSPCIDAGDNTAVTEAIDLDGRTRIVDGDGDGAATVDMGAYEYEPVVIYVDAAAPAGGNGDGWSTAFADLQEALDAAAGDPDQIWVAAGIYYPSTEVEGAGSRYRSFQLMNGVAVYGGFDATETSLSQRDVQNNVTILSGDIGTASDDSDNCYHVFHHPSGTNLDTTAILDGFTITAGNANVAGMPHDAGGGMRNESVNPTVRNCTFRGNSAIWGGGMENFEASPVIVNCTFSENFASVGGGVNNFNSNMLLTGCTFRDNSATRGGGMYSRVNSSPTLTDCAFSGNSASMHGGGMYNLANSTPTLINCTFGGNTANSYGGGMVNTQSSNPILTNCTFSENSADDGGGMYNNENSSPILTNSILWGNSDSGGKDESAQINTSVGTPAINYCCVQGLSGGLGGTGNIGEYPEFVDANGLDDIVGTEDDNLRLSESSPCIDAGDNTAVPVEVETDLDGQARIIDGDCNDSEIVDMGAYEFNYAYMGDLDHNCEVNFGDFAVLAENWELDNPAIDIAPFGNPDGIIDFEELLVIAAHWLKGVLP